LPTTKPSKLDFNSRAVTVGDARDCRDMDRQNIETLLRKWHPWRKGPYSIHGIYIDTEWRSDLKWNRLAEAIAPLKGRLFWMWAAGTATMAGAC